MYQINRDQVIHSLSFGFSMTKKEDSNKKRKKKGLAQRSDLKYKSSEF